MSNGEDKSLAQRLSEKTDKKPTTFLAMMEPYKAEIARALPRHLNADRICRIALTAFRRNPKLAECDPKSVFAAVIQAAQLGLEIDTLGQAYLVPYEKRKQVDGRWMTVGIECQFIPGWMGLVDLVQRSGRATVYSGVIMKDQKYRFQDGSERRLDIMNETEQEDPADITHAYAVGRVKGGVYPIIELWRAEKLVKHRDRYNKVGRKHYSYENWEMYCRKVVLLQVLKYLPKSVELTMAMELSHAAESPEGQGLTIEDSLGGSWAPPAEEIEKRETNLDAMTRTNGSPGPAKGSQSTMGADAGAQRGPARGSDLGRAKPPAADPASAPSPQQSDQPLIHGTGWPHLGADGLWRDSTGTTFREDQHGWNTDEKRPSVTAQGVFRARRGAGQGQAPAPAPRTVAGGLGPPSPIPGPATQAAHERAENAQQERGLREEEGW